MNIRVEYECTPIRHIAVQCPKCEKWFYGRDITEDKLNYSYEIYHAKFNCPICNRTFGADKYNEYSSIHIEETAYPKIYKDCLERKVAWE